MKMISKISIIVIMFISVIGFNSYVYAVDDTLDSSSEKSNTYSYTMSYKRDVHSSEYYTVGSCSVTSNVPFVLYWSDTNYLKLIYMDTDGSVSREYIPYFSALCLDCTFFDWQCCTYYYDSDGIVTSTKDYKALYDSGEISSISGGFGNFQSASHDFSHFEYATTNIPIFSNKEMAVSYLNGTVSISQAENYEDCINISYDSTDIPVPHNLKVTEESGKYYISWVQSADELPLISTVSYRHHIDSIQITHDTEGVYPTYPKKPELFYEPLLIHKYDITDDILNIVKFYREKCNVDSFKCSYVIRIRNKFDKSETEILYSNVVRAVLTISYDQNTGIKINAEYEERNESGDYVPDSSYNDYGDGSGLIRDDIGAASGGPLSTGNFISNIVNGFGLLGNGGIVSLTASALSFIPSELWTLIYFALSFFLIIALFKLVIK